MSRRATYRLDSTLRLDQVQVLGSHNSYHAFPYPQVLAFRTDLPRVEFTDDGGRLWASYSLPDKFSSVAHGLGLNDVLRIFTIGNLLANSGTETFDILLYLGGTKILDMGVVSIPNSASKRAVIVLWPLSPAVFFLKMCSAIMPSPAHPGNYFCVTFRMPPCRGCNRPARAVFQSSDRAPSRTNCPPRRFG